MTPYRPAPDMPPRPSESKVPRVWAVLWWSVYLAFGNLAAMSDESRPFWTRLLFAAVMVTLGLNAAIAIREYGRRDGRREEHEQWLKRFTPSQPPFERVPVLPAWHDANVTELAFFAQESGVSPARATAAAKAWAEALRADTEQRVADLRVCSCGDPHRQVCNAHPEKAPKRVRGRSE